MLAWIFGKVKHSEVHRLEADLAAGYIELDKARVRWMLSINANHLPKDIQAKGQRTFRSIQMEGKEIEFSEGFTDLHTKSYAEILKGNGFGLAEARQSIELVHEIRNTEIAKSKTSNNHPLLTTL
jgi:UDP-N-acetyl-2-amino-2-deoxyglucuronate dehydrogenase